MKILGIESSCDETAAAVVEDGVAILSSVVASQVDVHHPYGGVVPELAARKHIENIVPVVRKALEKAGMAATDVDAVAVTRGPGLVGALLVAFCFGKSFAYALDIPWVGVDHLEGHIHSVFLESPSPEFPFIALLASGGHTNLYYVSSPTRMECLGRTFDDAAGEAFDKVAKMLGLGYPGGKAIADLARTGDPEKISLPRPYLDKDAFNFSFSGLKSAVHRYIQTHPDTYLDQRADIAAAFQASVVDVLTFKVIHAARDKKCRHMALVGGVAANQRLREKVRESAKAQGMTVFLPSVDLCGDNAAMIAASGYFCLRDPDRLMEGLDQDVYSRAARK
ncbi:MAG: tRNA (adenosine(37)-N6)-threonylcarbamoyltransferase complex transferase subunit TsaD [Desulfobacterales bacterium CG23_combo_of_CG06-09_8_20_14_all_51_8]|nr:MAG: tRNA (adenosine(37)-N6)-threonylcarbamoyltransferase complex transferase subunit TsaD [Desulfobacterales bacterium CG23_combo_of_CG06-09_8_20_14_all_51_8]